MSQQAAHGRLVNDLAAAHTLVTATETGLLAELVERPATAANLATALGLDGDAVERMLAMLQGMGWAEENESGWQAAPWLEEAENAGLTVRKMSEVFRHLPQMARDGSVMMRGEVRHDSGVVRGLVGLAGEGPKKLAEQLPDVHGTILDIGAGSAIWSLAMVRDDTRVLALDRAEVLTAASRLADELGLGAALELLPGSFWEVEYPKANRVVIANVVHLLDDEASRRLIARAVDALEPGGDLVIVDVLGSDPLPPDVAAYALQLRLREPNGTVHMRERIESWLRDAGLRDVRPIELEAGRALSHGAVVGTRAE